MRIRDLMQKDVVTVDQQAHLDVAEELMRMDRIRHLPVVSGERLVGLVSQRDLFRAALSSALARSPEDEQRWLARIPVRQAMTREVLSAHPDADVGHAVEMMLRERVGCLPVVEDGRLVGLLSETDCLRHLAGLLAEG
ncbi:CBS domain-containing protein [Candidatus Binatia bacterium]|jgi:CBS domain-containing protein|nr:CBS domain-containing protein [Candidatus Binatia bacterium]